VNRYATTAFLGMASLLAGTLGAQEKAGTVFRVKVDMVGLSFTVTDSRGHYVNGLKLVSNYLLLQEVSTPPGELVVLAIGDDSPARVGDFGGGRCALYYIAQADVIASGAEPWRNPYA